MFDTLFVFIDQIVTQNIASMVGVFSSTIAPLLGACVILYALYLAYQSLYEPQNLVIMESMKFIASLAVVTTIALNTSWYLANIVPAVLGSGDQIAQALLGTTGGGGASLQAMFDTMLNSMEMMFNKIDLDMFSGTSWMKTWMTWVQMGLIILGFVPFLAVATAYLLVAKIMVSFFTYCWPTLYYDVVLPFNTFFFQAWTGQCFNYTLLSIMYPLAFTIFTQVLDQTVFAANLSIGTNIMTVIVFAALILLSVQIPTFCSTLSGGVGISGLVGGGMGVLNALRGRGKQNKDNGNKGKGGLGDLGKGKIKPG